MSDIFTPVDEDQVIAENSYERLVGEGKKFKDNEALARSKEESDRFIARLQAELEEAREATRKSLTLEEVQTKILEAVKTPVAPPQPPETPPAKTGEDSIENIVSSLLEKKESERLAKTNREKVTEALRQKFGNDVQLHLNQKAKELNLPLDYLAKVANDSPAAFFRLIGLENTAPTPTAPAPRSSVSSPAPAQSGVRNKAYYDKLKATDPVKYFSQEVRMQQYKDMTALGDNY